MAPAPPPDTSLLHTERISQYISLSPASLSDPLPALCAAIFSPLLLSYFAPARGIVLAYTDVSLSSSAPTQPSSSTPSGPDARENQDQILLLRHVDEYTAPFLWATATFLIWRPVIHAPISGRITHQSKTHITLSHLNTFPVSVTSECMPGEWTWRQDEAGKVSKGWDGRLSDEGGYWVDGQGVKVEGELEVRISDFDGRLDGKGRGKGFLRVEGTLVDERVRGTKGKERRREV